MILKTFIHIFTFIILGNSLHAQDWLKDSCELNGKIRSYNYEIKAYYGSKKPEVTQNEQYEYNVNGYLSRSTTKNKSFMGRLSIEIIRFYNVEMNQCLIEYHIQNGDTAFRCNFFYDDFGIVIKTDLYNWGELWSTEHYTYNNLNLLEKIESKNISGEIINTRNYKYDNDKRLIYFSEVSETYSLHIFQRYDENGRLIEKKHLDTNRAGVDIYGIDDNGNVLHTNSNDYSKAPNTDDSYVDQYNYNDLGQIIEETTMDLNGNIKYKSTYTYNELGDVQTLVTFSSELNETFEYNYVYNYDEKNNWIKKVCLLKGEIETEETRVIQYY